MGGNQLGERPSWFSPLLHTNAPERRPPDTGRRAKKSEQPAYKNPRCLSAAGASYEDFSRQTPHFLSDTDAVLTFFADFFVSRQKSRWGTGAKPLLLRFAP
jgi:hypothetical protein